MGRLLLIDALSAAALCGLWFFCLARYNRRQGTNALRWVEAACRGQGQIVAAHWIGPCQLRAHLRFASHWFENVWVTVRLLPRPTPLQWMVCAWRKEKDTLTFESDLDSAPSFHLETFRHRWHTQERMSARAASRNWAISRPVPVVLTTRAEWGQELTPVVNTLMTSPGHSLLSVRFRPESPHLAVTVTLDSLSDGRTAASFLGLLRELAAGASTHRQ